MSKIDDYTRLSHMRDAANEALFFIQGKTRESFNIVRKNKDIILLCPYKSIN